MGWRVIQTCGVERVIQIVCLCVHGVDDDSDCVFVCINLESGSDCVYSVGWKSDQIVSVFVCINVWGGESDSDCECVCVYKRERVIQIVCLCV